jgi:hypothetical protein
MEMTNLTATNENERTITEPNLDATSFTSDREPDVFFDTNLNFCDENGTESLWEEAAKKDLTTLEINLRKLSLARDCSESQEKLVEEYRQHWNSCKY